LHYILTDYLHGGILAIALSKEVTVEPPRPKKRGGEDNQED
jgi:hypothetical protein